MTDVIEYDLEASIFGSDSDEDPNIHIYWYDQDGEMFNVPADVSVLSGELLEKLKDDTCISVRVQLQKFSDGSLHLISADDEEEGLDLHLSPDDKRGEEARDYFRSIEFVDEQGTTRRQHDEWLAACTKQETKRGMLDWVNRRDFAKAVPPVTPTSTSMSGWRNTRTTSVRDGGICSREWIPRFPPRKLHQQRSKEVDYQCQPRRRLRKNTKSISV